MRLDIISESRVWLQSVYTHIDIKFFLFHSLKSWLTLDTSSNHNNYTGDPALQNIFRTQKLIGWEALFKGSVVTGMILYQKIITPKWE